MQLQNNILVMDNLMLLLSFLSIIIGVFIFRQLWLGALVAVLIVLSIKLFYFGNPDIFSVELINTLIIWSELVLLILGAYFFYFTLAANNHFATFTKRVSTVSSKVLLAVIICFFMGSFMEGIAGFGIPALLIAPLMIAIGFKPLTAIVLPLASNTTAVLFGALGTPLKIGLNIHEPNETIMITLLLNALPALLIPSMLAYLLSKTEHLKIEWTKEWKNLLAAGICFYIPFTLTGMLSIEFPSIVGGITGLLLFTFLFVPKNDKIAFKIWWNLFSPYLFFIILLIVWKYTLQNKLFGFTPNTKQFSLYQPGLVFIVAAIGVLFILNKKHFGKLLINQFRASLNKISTPTFTLFLLIFFTQLIAAPLSQRMDLFMLSANPFWQTAAQPIIGVCGSFITGSATMSNRLFAGNISTTGIVQQPLLTALMHTGSAAGNAISLQNIIMVKTATPENIADKTILKFNLPLIGFYFLLVLFSTLIYTGIINN